jgi:membrane protease subunit HflK
MHYVVSDPQAFVYGAASPDEVLAEQGRAAMVAAVGRRSQDDILTSGRAAIEDEVADVVQRMADRLKLGVRIASVRLTHVAVPSPALASFLDVISADEDRRTAINRAEAYSAKLIPEALGHAVAEHEGALAYAAERLAEARAEQSRFVARARGAKAGRKVTEFRLRMESLEAALVGREVVVAPKGVRIWMGPEGPVLGTERSAE